MLATLPYDILALIVSALSHDLPTLRALSLTASALLAPARPALFSAINACALQEAYMRPFLPLVAALRIEEPNPLSSDAVRGRFLPFLVQYASGEGEGEMARLRRLELRNAGVWFFVRAPAALYTTLGALARVTALSLAGGAYFTGLRQAQTLLCALPNLTSLEMRDVGFVPWKGAMPAGYAALEERTREERVGTRPKLERLEVAPTATTDEIAGWLGEQEASRESLRTLVVPAGADAPHFVLKHFGPGVEHLGIPLHGRGNRPCYSKCLPAYTALRSLTLFLAPFPTSPRAWRVLPLLLAHSICTTHLRALALEVSVPYPVLERTSWDLSAALDWESLAALDGTLAGPRFEQLESVRVSVRWVGAWTPGEGVCAELEGRVREVMGRARKRGVLGVSVGGVRVVYPRVYWRGNRDGGGER